MFKIISQITGKDTNEDMNEFDLFPALSTNTPKGHASFGISQKMRAAVNIVQHSHTLTRAVVSNRHTQILLSGLQHGIYVQELWYT